jgi:acetyl-CoA carboxylase biotin carboxyl carrier protein
VSGLSPEDIESFVQIFEASDWDRVDVVVGDIELHLSRTEATAARLVMRCRAVPNARPASLPTDIAALAMDSPSLEEHPALVEIIAPHVGTFLRAAKPDAPPLVAVGQSIRPDTEVCLLRVMKSSIGLRGGVNGVVREVRPVDGALVEGGEVLFLVEPSR